MAPRKQISRWRRIAERKPGSGAGERSPSGARTSDVPNRSRWSPARSRGKSVFARRRVTGSGGLTGRPSTPRPTRTFMRRESHDQRGPIRAAMTSSALVETGTILESSSVEWDYFLRQVTPPSPAGLASVRAFTFAQKAEFSMSLAVSTSCHLAAGRSSTVSPAVWRQRSLEGRLPPPADSLTHIDHAAPPPSPSPSGAKNTPPPPLVLRPHPLRSNPLRTSTSFHRKRSA